LSSLTAIFGDSEDKDQDSDKLLNLYWNRAELKKEFAGMRKEQFKLQDRIKQQEGATARLHQKLEHLEELLIDPQWVHIVVVFYQLRSLGLRCERKLAAFAEQLKQQREQKRHNSVLVQWNETRTAEAREIEQQILLKRDSVQQFEDQLQAERQRLMNMSGFLKIFRRRSVTAILDSLAEQLDLVRQDEFDLTQDLEKIRDRKPPDNEGLDIISKRSINLMILSFAQQLYALFADNDLAELVKESREKSVGAVNYGSRQECSALLDRIHQHVESMEQASDFAEDLQKRAKLLGQCAEFQDDSDAVPIAGSVASLLKFESNGVAHESEVNILSENYWAIALTLSR
jgi:hypothetical protein